MDNLYIDYEQGIVLGNKIRGEASELKTLLDNMREIEDRLNSLMESDEEKKYLSEINSQTKIMNMLADAVEETGTFLVNVSNAYSNAADENCGNIN